MLQLWSLLSLGALLLLLMQLLLLLLLLLRLMLMLLLLLWRLASPLLQPVFLVLRLPLLPLLLLPLLLPVTGAVHVASAAAMRGGQCGHTTGPGDPSPSKPRGGNTECG